MDTLKRLFPISFKRSKSVVDLIIGIIIYLVIGAIAGAVIALAAKLIAGIPAVGPIIAWALGIVSSLLGIWVFVGIVVLILAFLRILK